MNSRIRSRLVRSLVAVAIVSGTVLTAVPAQAAPPTSVDFTVRETFDGEPGVMIASDIDGCATATVTTIDPSVTETGPVSTFRGTKVVDCGGDDTFSLTYRASARGCSTTDSGRWKVIGGTGDFSGAKGHGSLVGTYRYLEGPGDACTSDEIDDHYTGKLKLAP